MIRVFIADDHALIRDGFAKLVNGEEDIRLVGEACSASQLFEMLPKAGRIDVLLLDIGLPDRNGLEVLKDLRLRAPEVRTLVLSMHPEERYALRAIADGAAGYVTKDSASEELVKAIRRVYTKGRYISETLAEQFLPQSRTEVETPPHTLLSDREHEILLLIGGGMSVREIAESLALSINTVNSYRRRLLQKMSLKSNGELIRYVLRHQLIE
ncbi:MAG: DNA-binding response regulator [Spirochaetaceae bacterium]|nr:MAG: DNA-binding response regulator [Spirochaetaceae bacterium]